MMGLAHSGMMLGSAPAGSEPVYPTAGINDRLGAIGMVFGILAALVDRQRTGVGQLVETSLLGWMVNLQVVGAQIAANTGQDLRPTPRDDANDPLYNYYRCGDGTWIALGMLGYGNRFWPHLCTALGRPDLATDDRFADQDSRELNRRALIAIRDECFARVSFEEWDRLAKQHDFISTKVNALTDLVTDEQVLANGYLEQHPHPDLGTWWYAPTPIPIPPHPGQHPVRRPTLWARQPLRARRRRLQPGRNPRLGEVRSRLSQPEPVKPDEAPSHADLMSASGALLGVQGAYE